MHARACDFLKIPPLATLEHETYHHERSKCAPKEKPAKTAPIIQPNSKLKHKCSAHNIMSNKQLLSLTRQMIPDFTSKTVTNNSLKYKSS